MSSVGVVNVNISLDHAAGIDNFCFGVVAVSPAGVNRQSTAFKAANCDVKTAEPPIRQQ